MDYHTLNKTVVRSGKSVVPGIKPWKLTATHLQALPTSSWEIILMKTWKPWHISENRQYSFLAWYVAIIPVTVEQQEQ